jgi:hypothetical protein
LRDEKSFESEECILDKACDENDMVTDMVLVSNNNTSERSPSGAPTENSMESLSICSRCETTSMIQFRVVDERIEVVKPIQQVLQVLTIVDAVVSHPRRLLQVGNVDDLQLPLGQELELLRNYFVLVSIE